VFGLKAFPMQLQSLEQSNPVLLREVLAVLLAKDRPRHVVYLRRRDIVAQTVSYARANMTGVWRKEQESAAPREMEYSQDQLEAAERGIGLQQSVWERMFIDLRIDPLELWHEDVLDNPAQAIKQVAQYLGVPIETSSKVAIPEIRKQSPGNTQAWIDRYARSRPVE
jgi:LPS sulfotransferase NodH